MFWTLVTHHPAFHLPLPQLWEEAFHTKPPKHPLSTVESVKFFLPEIDLGSMIIDRMTWGDFMTNSTLKQRVKPLKIDDWSR